MWAQSIKYNGYNCKEMHFEIPKITPLLLRLSYEAIPQIQFFAPNLKWTDLFM